MKKKPNHEYLAISRWKPKRKLSDFAMFSCHIKCNKAHIFASIDYNWKQAMKTENKFTYLAHYYVRACSAWNNVRS